MAIEGLFAGPSFGWHWAFGADGDGGAGWGHSGGSGPCTNNAQVDQYFAENPDVHPGDPGAPTYQSISCPGAAEDWHETLDAANDFLMGDPSSWGYPDGAKLADLRPKPDFLSIELDIEGGVGSVFTCDIEGVGPVFFYYSPVCRAATTTGTDTVTVYGASGAAVASSSVSGNPFDLITTIVRADGTSPYDGDPGNPEALELFVPSEVGALDWNATSSGASFVGGGASNFTIHAWYLTNPTEPPEGAGGFMAIV